MAGQSRKARLVELAHDLAREQHGPGYGKPQLIAAAKSAFGGRAANPYNPVRTTEDIENQRNAMAIVDGNYPLSIGDCEVVGISGGCGLGCPVLRAGRCDSPPTEGQ